MAGIRPMTLRFDCATTVVASVFCGHQPLQPQASRYTTTPAPKKVKNAAKALLLLEGHFPSAGLCSGVRLDKNSILTTAHWNLQNKNKPNAVLHVTNYMLARTFPHSALRKIKAIAAKDVYDVVKTDVKSDLTLLQKGLQFLRSGRTQHYSGSPKVKIAQAPAHAGDKVYLIAGNLRMGGPQIIEGFWVGHKVNDRDAYNKNYVSQYARFPFIKDQWSALFNGFSGGMLVNEQGRLLGVLQGGLDYKHNDVLHLKEGQIRFSTLKQVQSFLA